MKIKKLFSLLICALLCGGAVAQTIKVKGRVTDAAGDGMPGVSVYPKAAPTKGVITSITGDYELSTTANAVIVYSFVGYTTQELKMTAVAEQTVNVKLEEASELLDEVAVVGYGTQRKVSVVGSITTVQAAELQRGAVTSVSNSLAGRIAGLIGVQHSGEPGQDVSEFWVRGISTFGGGANALVLIDGIDRGTSGLNDLAPQDIESFSVLKDASATAIYGARGANGVIIITTKRGTEQATKISADFKSTIEWLPRLPNYLRSHEYAQLANEAKVVRGDVPLYSPDIFDVLKYKMDLDLYPDVSWKDEVLKKSTWASQANVNISGGGKQARYYMSMYYRTNDAIYKQTGMERYNTNVRRNQYSFRSNIDVNVTKTTKVSLLLSAKLVDQNHPGSGIGTTNNIWSAITNITPLTVPVKYSNGLFPSYGQSNQTSPTILLNETGYRTTHDNTIESIINVEQDLKFITPGLKLTGLVSVDNYNNHVMARNKMPDLYMAVDRNWQTGELLMTKTVVGTPMNFSTSSYGTRTMYTEARLNYDTDIADRHRIGAMLVYQQRNYQATNRYGELSSIPNRNQGIAGRLTYSLDDIYFFEGNFGYNGSENFPKGQRFGFFPSMAVGWVLSNYDYVKDNFDFIEMLKLRYSYGLVGNDQISGGTRFPYLTTVNMSATGYAFGDQPISYGGVTDSQLGSTGLAWETAVKNNWGIDLQMFDGFSLTVDAFLDKRDNIYMTRSTLPGTLGVRSTIWGNVGRMKSWGSDGTASYHKKLGEFDVEVRGNFTFTRDKIIDYDETPKQYPYQAMKGTANNLSRGLIALGLFKDEDDVRNSPSQYGTVLPGDIKYQDVNGDGVIDSYDVLPIGNANVPKIQYGFAGSVAWKGFDFNIFLRGSGKTDFFFGGSGFYPFNGEKLGNVLTIVADQKNRWTPASYSGDPATENPDARFPRLTYGNNTNNNRNSTFWMADASFLRLKTLELGYTVPASLAGRLKMRSLRLSLLGDNLHVWDNVKLWDPEQTSSNGAAYPLTRSVTFTVQMSF
ncbi:MAG: TonB-dependent receptor [Bacteroidales bacterium]|jgi:TonB-linked SusC/RagA family outer membrane protein|nr:TonB-dependent receptor [Bacteroidales bacterium]